jgi:pimeloyl-ACP methyl ester carboxylesterase
MKKYVHFRGKKIFYSDEGSGPALMLIHGYLETGEAWGSFAAELSEKFRVIVVDLPGHGQSDIFGEIHSMEFMAEAMNGLLGTIGLSKVFMIGHSMGGYVTLAFLEMFRDKLSGYSLFHSHPFADTPEVLKKRDNEILTVNAGRKYLIVPDNIKRMFAPANLEKFTTDLDRLKKIAAGIRAEGITAVLRGMKARPSRAGLMESVNVPCLWILGASDNYINCDSVKSRIKLPPDSRLVILEKSGHLGFIEEKQVSRKAVTDFLKPKVNQ